MKKTVKSVVAFVLVAASLFALTSCAGNSGGTSPNATVTIGSKDFTESLIVSEVYALALSDNGFKVNRKFNIGSSVPQCHHQRADRPLSGVYGNRLAVYPQAAADYRS